MQHKSLAVIYNNFNKETGTENVKAMFSVCQIFFFSNYFPKMDLNYFICLFTIFHKNRMLNHIISIELSVSIFHYFCFQFAFILYFPWKIFLPSLSEFQKFRTHYIVSLILHHLVFLLHM